jgi:dihydrofolate reductase
MKEKNIVSIIVAMDEKRGIGKNSSLLFKIPEDFKRMSAITSGHPIIMGRKTWESIPENRRPLPRRYNIVITRDLRFKIDDLREGEGFGIVNTLENAIEKAKKSPGSEEIFIFGGGQIFKEAMEKGLVDKLYLTIVEGDYGADTFFPDYSDFKKIIFEKSSETEGYKYRFLELERV